MAPVQTARNIAIATYILSSVSFGWGQAVTSVTTGQYDNSRTGANLNEVILTPSNVNSTSFGKLGSWQVDGNIFAQPLYVAGVKTKNGVADLVFVATMHNTIYAFKADQPGSAPVWSVNLAASVPQAPPSPVRCPAGYTLAELGILSTPVIDLTTNTLYAIAATPVKGAPTSTSYTHNIYALDIGTGAPKFHSPVRVTPTVKGNGYDAQGGKIALDNSNHVQRTALLLSQGVVYAGFGGCGPDNDPWHGWILGYSASNLQKLVVAFNDTPNTGQNPGRAGIWQGGRGPIDDSSGNIYFQTGNGDVASSPDSYGESLVKLSPSGVVIDHFTPQNWQALNDYDLDLSSSGPLRIPGTNLIVSGGKEGVIYVFDQNNLRNPVQQFQATTLCTTLTFNGCYKIFGIAYWNGFLYIWGSRDTLRAYQFSGGTFNPTPVAQNTSTVAWYGVPLAVSANGSSGGILWATTGPPPGTSANPMLHAYDATNIATELWNSDQNSARDALPSFVRFAEPLINNGRVYVPTFSNQLVVYGRLP